ncbi:MAG: rhomboid family intramembrane serine protease [Candidatus Aenigmarchaeota archaeon]|nr:rhomboid family intramembrane serine protease [Candidatus Aenigmarchaeota archaeon]
MKYSSLILVAICVVVFVLQYSITGFTDTFVLDSSKVWQEPWRLITSIFLHGGLEHLVFNMFALALFGFILENTIDTRKFLFLFFVGGFVASIFSAIFYSSSLGASGAIFAVIGTLAIVRWKMTVWFFGIPMPMFVAAVLWAITDIVGVFYPSNVANFAHLAGLGFGIIFAYFVREYIDKGEKKKKRVIKDDEIDEWEDFYFRKPK